MFIAAIIVNVPFALLLALSATGKLRHDPSQLATLERVGAAKLAPMLAVAELAGAGGLLVGLAWWPLGVAAGTGLALYFLGAVGSHLRIGDRAVVVPGALLVVAVATVVLRIASAG